MSCVGWFGVIRAFCGWLHLWLVVSFALGLACGGRCGFACTMIAARLFWFGCFYVVALGLIVML